MVKVNRNIKKKIEFVGFVLAWFAVITQFVMIIQNRVEDISETIIRFFSFFTILTNVLVALFFTSKVFKLSMNPFHLFNKKGTLTALTTFILIVGLVYQLILRGIWEPQGMQHIADELLHSVIPLYVLIYWFVFSIREKINFRDVSIWLLYPFVYIIFVFTRGHFSGYYPYPFLNIPEIGIERALLNVILILIFMIVIMSILYVVYNKQRQVHDY